MPQQPSAPKDFHFIINSELAPLREDVIWLHQPAFDKAFSDLTGEPCEHHEWRREVNWNFTADDRSFTE